MSRALIIGLVIAGPTALLLAGLADSIAHRRPWRAAGCVAGLALLYIALPALAAWDAAQLRRN
jgi:hypothetical protein